MPTFVQDHFRAGGHVRAYMRDDGAKVRRAGKIHTSAIKALQIANHNFQRALSVQNDPNVTSPAFHEAGAQLKTAKASIARAQNALNKKINAGLASKPLLKRVQSRNRLFKRHGMEFKQTKIR